MLRQPSFAHGRGPPQTPGGHEYFSFSAHKSAKGRMAPGSCLGEGCTAVRVQVGIR